MDLFVEFRGRKPSLEPLLRQHGLTAGWGAAQPALAEPAASSEVRAGGDHLALL